MKITFFNDWRLGVLKGADRIVDVSAIASRINSGFCVSMDTGTLPPASFSSAGNTRRRSSSSGTGVPFLNFIRPRRVASRRDWSSTRREYCLKMS